MLRWSWGPELFCGLGEELGLGVLSSLWPWGGPPQNRPLQVLVPLGGPHLPRTKLLCGCFVLALEPRQASDRQQSSRLCLRCWRERGSRIGSVVVFCPPVGVTRTPRGQSLVSPRLAPRTPVLRFGGSSCPGPTLCYRQKGGALLNHHSPVIPVPPKAEAGGS